MTHSFKLKLLASTVTALLLSGCGDAETTIIEKDPIVVPDDGHDDDNHDHDDGYTIESMGRLAVLSAETPEAMVFDLDDGDLLDTFSLVNESNALNVSADYRYAVIASRAQDTVGFIDGGLWREDHGDHLHDYKQGPAMSDYELSGSRPTHVVKHDGQMAVFYDGDAEAGIPAAVQVVTDSDISNETNAVPGLAYDINMHGVAEPRGEHLLATLRRDDAESNSATKILPDQVGVYHLHDGEYELEQTLQVNCPDLHGAAQNHEFVLFGCSDGVLIAHQHDDEYEAEKVANIDELDGMRIGTIFGHEESESFFGIASSGGHGATSAVLVVVNPAENEMELLEWQPEASPIAYAFSNEGEHFLVLDSQGYLNILSAHEHDGHVHWELEEQLDISEQDVSTMPQGMSFSMTIAQNGPYVYVADPIAQHILQIHLEDMEIEGDIELDFAPSAITWLGVAEEHDH